MATKLTWQGTTQYTDGRPYGQADHGGYELEINGQPAVAIPVAWQTSNQYEFLIKDLPNLNQGDNTLRMRTVAANGQASVWTSSVTFPYASTPEAPQALVAQ